VDAILDTAGLLLDDSHRSRFCFEINTISFKVILNLTYG
jgi:hypothetical protein